MFVLSTRGRVTPAPVLCFTWSEVIRQGVEVVQGVGDDVVHELGDSDRLVVDDRNGVQVGGEDGVEELVGVTGVVGVVLGADDLTDHLGEGEVRDGCLVVSAGEQEEVVGVVLVGGESPLGGEVLDDGGVQVDDVEGVVVHASHCTGVSGRCPVVVCSHPRYGVGSLVGAGNCCTPVVFRACLVLCCLVEICCR